MWTFSVIFVSLYMKTSGPKTRSQCCGGASGQIDTFGKDIRHFKYFPLQETAVEMRPVEEQTDLHTGTITSNDKIHAEENQMKHKHANTHVIPQLDQLLASLVAMSEFEIRLRDHQDTTARVPRDHRHARFTSRNNVQN